MATVVACGGFAAITGSSPATAATMGKVALPEMKKFNYDTKLTAGAVAAGGTLGILIPPSMGFILYGILTEESVGKLFMAGVIPGLLEILFYVATIFVMCGINPSLGPAGPKTSIKEKVVSLRHTWAMMALFMLVIGGIYGGIFTPTEAAAFGVIGVGATALANGMRMDGLKEALTGTAVSTGMIYMILLGADIFNAFLSQTQLPQTLAESIGSSGLSPMMILIMILLLYLVLGCVIDALSMILLTIPIFFPIISALDFGMSAEHTAIWFGIIVLIVVEVGLITPPVGLNVFVINSLARDIPMIETFKGVIPFLISDAVRVALIILLPVITLILPRLLAIE